MDAAAGAAGRGERMRIEKAIRLLIEEYEKAKRLDFVRKPLAWALYQVWKKVDVEEKENK